MPYTQASRQPIIQMRHTAFMYSQVWTLRPFWALRGINLTVTQGEHVAVIGDNGSGKTTLLRLLLGSLWPTKGSIQYKPHIYRSYFPHKGPSLVLGTGADNLHWARKWARLWSDKSNPVSQIDQGIGLPDLDQRVDRMSFGQRKKIEIAMALAQNPDLVLMDEPTAGLDPGSREDLLHWLKNWSSGSQASVLLTTHRLSEAFAFADRVIFLRQGKTLWQLRKPPQSTGWFLTVRMRHHHSLPNSCADPGSQTHNSTWQNGLKQKWHSQGLHALYMNALSQNVHGSEPENKTWEIIGAAGPDLKIPDIFSLLEDARTHSEILEIHKLWEHKSS